MAESRASTRKSGLPRRLWRGLAPAMPAAVGTTALTGLFAGVMPLPWVEYLSWNLYLDALGPWFAAPVGNAGRLALAIIIALLAGVVALVIALMLVKPPARGNKAMNNRVAQRARAAEQGAAAGAGVLTHRAADAHPDAPPRAPINAARDLPAGGLGPVDAAAPLVAAEPEAPPLVLDGGDFPAVDADDASDDLDLGGFAMAEEAEEAGAPDAAPDTVPDAAPVAATAGPATLGALVERLESSLDRRRARAVDDSGDSGALDPAKEDDEPVVDLALEAALSTLQRMTARAAG